MQLVQMVIILNAAAIFSGISDVKGVSVSSLSFEKIQLLKCIYTGWGYNVKN